MPAPDALRRAAARVLGIDAGAAHLRGDTPLVGLGVDSLALLCLADALADDGWQLDERAAASARTLGDVEGCMRPVGSGSEALP